MSGVDATSQQVVRSQDCQVWPHQVLENQGWETDSGEFIPLDTSRGGETRSKLIISPILGLYVGLHAVTIQHGIDSPIVWLLYLCHWGSARQTRWMVDGMVNDCPAPLRDGHWWHGTVWYRYDQPYFQFTSRLDKLFSSHPCCSIHVRSKSWK